VLSEGALIALALAIGSAAGVAPLGLLRLDLAGVAAGVLAALPMLGLLAWCLRTPWLPMRRLVTLVEERLGPYLADAPAGGIVLLAGLAGLGEELLFRGVIQAGLAERMPVWLALAAASLLFGAGHWVSASYAALAALIGAYLGGVLLVTGNLLAPIVAHAVYDVVALTVLARRPVRFHSMDAIEAIQRRTSVRRYRAEPVSRETIALLLDCAVRAPNHKLTEPWRFAVLTGGAKGRLAEIKARHRLKRYEDPSSAEALAAMEKVRRETTETPAIIVVMARAGEDEITREEDYAAVMMATANLMTAAQSLGLGTYLKTGGVMRDPALAELVGLPETHRVVGVLSLGYPAEAEAPRRRKPAGELTRWVE
jgi:nitroreductase/membrane protease YdiL (CAAX protease family)